VSFYVLFLSIELFYVLFVCKCVLYYCQRVSTQFQLNISYNFKYHHKSTTASFIELHTKDTAVNNTNILRSSCHVPDNVVRFKKKIIFNRFS